VDCEAAFLALSASFGDLGEAVAMGGLVEVHLFAVIVHGFAMFPGKNTHKLQKESGFSGGRAGELKSALFDGLETSFIEVNGLGVVEVEELLDAFSGVFGQIERLRQFQLLVVAEEFVDGNTDARFQEDELLNLGIGAGPEEVVDFLDLSLTEAF
jgi:hypothetical protein